MRAKKLERFKKVTALLGVVLLTLLFPSFSIAQSQDDQSGYDLSYVKVRWEVSDATKNSIEYEDLQKINSAWSTADASQFPWHPRQFKEGWVRNTPYGKAGIFVAFQAPIYKLGEDEYVTTLAATLDEMFGVKYEGTKFYPPKWKLHYFSSLKGNGLSFEYGNIPTKVVYAEVQLDKEENSDVYPIVLVYGAAPMKAFDQVEEDLRKFLATFKFKPKEEAIVGVSPSQVEKKKEQIMTTAPQEEALAKRRHVRTYSIGATRSLSGLSGIAFFKSFHDSKLWITLTLGLQGMISNSGEDSTSHLDVMLGFDDVWVKQENYFIAYGLNIGTRLHRHLSLGDNPIVVELPVGIGIKPLANTDLPLLMFSGGLVFCKSKKDVLSPLLNMKSPESGWQVGTGVGIKILL